MALTGRIHSLESFGAVDGPGVRYVIFFQGCPLRCIYGHYPDTWPRQGGREVTVQELVEGLLPFRPFLRSGGVTLTGAGATWPYGVDPEDTNIRIAPSFPSLGELDRALDVFVTCVKLVSARLAREGRSRG